MRAGFPGPRRGLLRRVLRLSAGAHPPPRAQPLPAAHLPRERPHWPKAVESAAQTQCQRLENSLFIVFGILEKIKCEAVTRQVSDYLSAAVYQAFRLLYSATGEKPPGGLLPGPGAVRRPGGGADGPLPGERPASCWRGATWRTAGAWPKASCLP